MVEFAPKRGRAEVIPPPSFLTVVIAVKLETKIYNASANVVLFQLTNIGYFRIQAVFFKKK